MYDPVVMGTTAPGVTIDRRAFIQRWRDRASSGIDPFDEFFSLWLALVISARPSLQAEDFAAADPERCSVLRLAAEHRDTMFREIDSCKDELAWLAHRRGTVLGLPIVDVHEFVRKADHLRRLFATLSDHYLGNGASEPGLIVDAVIELLNHVRNNLFHGLKNPDDVDDRQLIERLNPILHAVLKAAT